MKKQHKKPWRGEMSEISELNEINEQDERREDLKKEADIKAEEPLSNVLKAYKVRSNDPLVYRYWDDPEFAALVDFMAASIIANDYKTLDIFVDAAMVAINLAQENKIRNGQPST
jgi:hypothetical protein